MSVIKLEKIVSVSSEDPSSPAESLLKQDYGGKKWRCKSAGEKSVSVILQFEKASVIKSVDVGNEHSGFIEILVGKSSSSNEDYKVLLVTSSLMTLQESKCSSNVNGVKFFKEDDFSETVRNEKWDRVKIVCTQPFNKHVLYGLSFIVFRTVEELKQSGSDNLGKFLVKQDPVGEQATLAPGSLFARRKEFAQEEVKAAAAIRAASSNIDMIKPLKTPKGKTQNTGPPFSSRKRKDEECSDDSGDEGSTRKKTPKAKKDEARGGPKKPANGVVPKRDAPSTSSTPAKKARKDDKPGARKKTKPFEKLFEGVVFVISGFQNPLRSDIRSKALEMGARYKADWDSSCTHLICAFANTPKYNQVLGQGKIVRKEWIENSYARRSRIPWRRYALDKNDAKRPESEEEVHEEEPEPTPSLFPDNRRRVNSSDESNSDTEQQRHETKKVTPKKSPQDQPRLFPDCNDTKDKGKEELEKTKPPPDDIYDMDTEVDEDIAEDGRNTRALPYISDFFDDLSFYICNDLGPDERKEMLRYIIAHKGKVQDEVNGDVEYVVSMDPGQVEKAKAINPVVIGVKPEWVLRAHDENRLIPSSKFEL